MAKDNHTNIVIRTQVQGIEDLERGKGGGEGVKLGGSSQGTTRERERGEAIVERERERKIPSQRIYIKPHTYQMLRRKHSSLFLFFEAQELD